MTARRRRYAHAKGHKEVSVDGHGSKRQDNLAYESGASRRRKALLTMATKEQLFQSMMVP
jgi:hypothetical protein